ncbi:MAG: hypothetical protein AAB524_02975 [Patescibacteria group bacterium]
MQNKKLLNKVDKLGYVLVTIFLVLCIFILVLLITGVFTKLLNTFNKEFLSGAGVAIFSFLLAAAWDEYKFRRDVRRKDEAVMFAVQEDLRSNLKIAEENKRMLEEELSVLKDHRTITPPLRLLGEGFWTLVRVNPPQKLVRLDSIVKIHGIGNLTGSVNEMLRSRENYRIQNQAMDNFCKRLETYDRVLIEEITKLQSILSAFVDNS